MPLSAATPRAPIHARRIEMQGYLRQDGLWDIEGRLTDGKSYSFKNDYRGEVKVGDFIHEMWLRLVVDDGLTIVAVEAATDNSPFGVCPAILPEFQKLVGLKIAKGFNGKVFELFGGVHGCTHHVELIGRLATVAFQTIFPYRNRMSDRTGEPVQSNRRMRLLNTCHAFAETGELAQRIWPDLAAKTKS
ncbi:MAG TPA: DUF2889 domain-containing protein [Stellaceae bacterium]|jgi:hypothetical protein|nr:DUF2889 domain-containing protein [Stellaceae bacterium]